MSHEQRDAFGYTESQYEAADKMLDRQKDDRLERERADAAHRLGRYVAELLRSHVPTKYEPHRCPMCHRHASSLSVPSEERDLGHIIDRARSLGLLTSPLSPAALDRMLGDIERAPDEKR